MPVPCGKCTHCLINRRRVWTLRLILESYSHEHSCFPTLTYDNEHLPIGGSLDFNHTKKFIKKLRKKYPPGTIRYYLVGEYGTKSSRPHYHAIIFGVSEHDSEIIEQCWTDRTGKPRGNVLVGSVTPDSIAYTVGYILKRQNKKFTHDMRVPEQSRCSNRPGIGFNALEAIKHAFKTQHSRTLPQSISIGGKHFPIGRYLTNKLREQLAGQVETQEENAKRYEQEMLALYESAVYDQGYLSLQGYYEDKNQTLNLSLEARQKIFNQKRTI